MSREQFWGRMDWPLDRDAKCLVCATKLAYGMTWGITNAKARCNVCHTHYYLRDSDGNVVTTPRCLLKEEYVAPAQVAWATYKTPLDQLTDDQWDLAISIAEET